MNENSMGNNREKNGENSREKNKERNSGNEKLWDQLQGKNTIETALFLALEFVCRFGEDSGNVSDLASQFLPRGRASSWAMLDRNINLFCRRFYSTWEVDEEKIAFFDEVRFFLQTLPMKRDYKIDTEKFQIKLSGQIATRPLALVHDCFVSCALCWRSVYRLPLEKKTPLCHLHDIPSTFPEYRKRMRLKKHVETIKYTLLKSLPPLNDLKRQLGTEQLNDYVQSLCLDEEGSFPYLAKYLRSLSLPLDAKKEILQKEILRALEHPIYFNKISSFVREAWEYYLDDKAEYFKENYLQFLNAEAWLRAEAEHKHGGKRR